MRKRRDAIAAGFCEVDFLKKLAASNIEDRLLGIAREFTSVLDLGCHTGEMANHIPEKSAVKTLVQTDLSEQMVRQKKDSKSYASLVCDEEKLPFAANSFEAVLSSLSLHHVNDLVGTLIQINHILKPDGLFIAVLFGANTLRELRECLVIAAAELNLGLAPHISPFPEIRDAGSLLGRAGFALPVTDSEELSISYDSAYSLMKELKKMGESNILAQQHKGIMSKKFFALTADIYQQKYPCPNEQGRITATVELITMTAWKPHESQQKPLPRGSGKLNLKDFL